MEIITSRKNEKVRQASKLLSSAQERKNQKAFLCEGARLCADAAESGTQIINFFYTEEAKQKYNDYFIKIFSKAENSYCVQPHVFELLTETKSPQGISCVCAMNIIQKTEEDFFCQKAEGSCAAFENIQNPANMGTMLRTAEALGVSSVILCGNCCDIFSPKVLRGSMGAVFRMPVYYFKSIKNSAENLKNTGWNLFASVPSRKAISVTNTDFSKPSIMLVGNEGNGLKEETIAVCQNVTIPMLGRAESLNASASTAILLWEMIRGRLNG